MGIVQTNDDVRKDYLFETVVLFLHNLVCSLESKAGFWHIDREHSLLGVKVLPILPDNTHEQGWRNKLRTERASK